MELAETARDGSQAMTPLGTGQLHRCSVRKRSAMFRRYPSVPANSIEPMRPELRAWHLRRQEQLERLGLWDRADFLNACLSGAFISESDFAAGRIPAMRRSFLRRMRRATKLIGSTRRGNQ
jgi:hypothetical protein